MRTLELRELGQDDAGRWDDLIAPFQSRELFHRKAWLDYLAVSRGVQIRLWEICEAGRTVGYFCGGILQKGPFRVLGSPLKGWGTNFMGPVAGAELDQSAFLQALDEMAIRERIAMVEIESRMLTGEWLRCFDYEPETEHTFVIELTPTDPERMWRRLHPKARKAVRLASQFGAKIEDTNDPSIGEELYDQYKEAIGRKNLYPTFDRICPRLMFSVLRPLDLLFALRVRDPNGNAIASGLFPHDDRAMYFTFTGSRIAGWRFFPNDLLQWKAMQIAACRGLTVYNMCGRGQFKSKFGGNLAEVKRWHKYFWHSARWARRGYEFYFQKQHRLRAWVHGALGHAPGPARVPPPETGAG